VEGHLPVKRLACNLWTKLRLVMSGVGLEVPKQSSVPGYQMPK